MLEGADASDGFEAADAGGYGLLADDFEDADNSYAVNVGAAAEFFAVEAAGGAGVGHGDYADVAFRIFVAEEGQGAGGQGFFERSDVGFDLAVVADFVVDLLLDVAQLFG